MMSKLLPCPFCGGEPVLKQYRADGLEIKCSNCHSGRQQRWLHKGRDWLAEKMIEKWNERAPLSPDHSGGEGTVVVPDGWKLVPIEPTAEMLGPIRRSKWPEDFEAGKRLQRLRGPDVVCYNTETECAVGQYERMLAAAPNYFDKVKELNQ